MLGLGVDGADWECERIGTEKEKIGVERELVELRERLSKVEEWKARRQEIERELAKVWVTDGDELAPPPYLEHNGREESTQRGTELES